MKALYVSIIALGLVACGDQGEEISYSYHPPTCESPDPKLIHCEITGRTKKILTIECTDGTVIQVEDNYKKEK